MIILKMLKDCLLVFIGIFVAFTGCENNFQPLVENHSQHFSIYGVLDASADTQWVRVMPVRKSILTSPEPIDAQVTITHIESGEKVILNDSLFNSRPGYFAWNFWTTAPVNTGETYLFEARDSDGNTSSAEIEIPDDFPTPKVIYERGDYIARIQVQGVENLSVARIFYFFTTGSVPDIGPVYYESISQLNDVRNGIGGLEIHAYPAEDMGEISESWGTDRINVYHQWQEVMIVSGGDEWPDYQELDIGEEFLPDTESNIVNGVGVLAGAVSKTVPLQSCFDENEVLVACETIDRPPHKK